MCSRSYDINGNPIANPNFSDRMNESLNNAAECCSAALDLSEKAITFDTLVEDACFVDDGLPIEIPYTTSYGHCIGERIQERIFYDMNNCPWEN